MFDFSNLQEVYREMKSIPAAERGPFTTTFVMTALAYIVYYIAAATTIIVLGRRLIQASFAAFKEARRDRV